MDRISKEERSKNMAAVRSNGNKSTELEFVKLLKKNKITGWKRHNRNIVGNPDFFFSKNSLVVFIDGCFWHGCRKHFKLPKSNRKFWQNKIASNKKRDKKVNSAYKRMGWKVLRFWEHQIKKNPKHVLRKISKELE